MRYTWAPCGTLQWLSPTPGRSWENPARTTSLVWEISMRYGTVCHGSGELPRIWELHEDSVEPLSSGHVWDFVERLWTQQYLEIVHFQSEQHQ